MQTAGSLLTLIFKYLKHLPNCRLNSYLHPLKKSEIYLIKSVHCVERTCQRCKIKYSFFFLTKKLKQDTINFKSNHQHPGSLSLFFSVIIFVTCLYFVFVFRVPLYSYLKFYKFCVYNIVKLAIHWFLKTKNLKNIT